MHPTDVIAVVGSCPAERSRAAASLANETGSMLLTATRIAMSPAPIHEALALVPWAHREGRAVVEFPSATSMTGLIGALCDDGQETARLIGITCVVDAVHLLDDLRRDDYFVRYGLHGERGYARALTAVEQIEFASTVLLVNWEPLSTPNLSAIMAVVTHLSPRARLQLDRSGIERAVEPMAYSAEQERPGWVAILNDEFDPHITDPRVTALRYEQLRPMHPERLERLLDGDFSSGRHGTVLRSAGFCRLASRPRLTAKWEHVGRMFSLHPLAVDDEVEAGIDAGEEALGFGQDIAVIGIDLDRDGLIAALDAAALTDEEFAAGPEFWAGLSDPFPVSHPSAP
ncbi:MAG: GTP-binding protein [Leucobacter sp.]